VLSLLGQSIQDAPLLTVPDGFTVADHEHPHLMRCVFDVVGDAHMTNAELVQPMEWRMQGGPICEWGLGQLLQYHVLRPLVGRVPDLRQILGKNSR